MKPAFLPLAIGLVLAGCASAPPQHACAGHIIIPSARQISVIGEGEWMPEEAQLVLLEGKIVRLFARPDERLRGVLTRDRLPPRQAPAPLSDYYVRFCGIIRDGHKLIVGKASHREVSNAARLLRIRDPDSVELDAFGGGTHYFTVTYDPQAGKIITLDYNAPL